MAGDLSPFILSIGRLDHIKGFNLMIEAMSNISSQWKYVIVGPDQQNYSAILEKIILDLGLNERVIITGALPGQCDVQNALDECEFLVVPSYFEAFGQVILEGCLAKKPIIMSKGCRISSDFSQENALIVEPNAIDIAEACSRFIENKSFRELYAERSYKFCIDNFTLHIVIQKLINMYSQILNDTKTVNNFR
jgi:glycosyltransferase involved in cell wall biosynthesis